MYRIVYRKKALLYGKCVYSVSNYLGQIIDWQGVRNDPSKVQAVVDFPKPHDVAEFRWFLGVVNQRTKFCPNLAVHTKPPRDLLRTNTAWLLGPHEEDAFTCLKKELASELVLSIYHPECGTIVSTDASSYGLVAALLQLQPTGELKPVAYASRSMTDTECRYVQIEKEALLINLVSRTSSYQR